MEATASVIVFLVATTVVLVVSVYASMALRRDLEDGALAKETARRHAADTRFARLLAIAGWDTWRYADAATPAALIRQTGRCIACTHVQECDDALACGNTSAIMTFCPNASTVRPVVESGLAAAH